MIVLHNNFLLFILFSIVTTCFSFNYMKLNRNDQIDHFREHKFRRPVESENNNGSTNQTTIVLPDSELEALIGDDNQTAEKKQVRKKFVQEVLSDPKLAKMRKYIQERANSSKSIKVETPTKNVAKVLEQINNIDRSGDRFVVKDQPTIDSINEPIKDLLIGGDGLLSNDQIDQLQPYGKMRRKRQLQTGDSNKWDPKIPISFIFDSSLDEKTQSLIRLSIEFWSNNTCLSFKEDGTSKPIVRFFKGNGCYSMLGKLSVFLSQDISIGSGCENFGIITHEIGHTLGVWHQQSRPDRDASITILLEEVELSWRPQYDKQYQTETQGVSYDYGSIMHYPAYQNHGDTVVMIPTDKRYIHTMGNNYGPVFSDLLAVNRYYKCTAHCNDSKSCANEGFQNSKDCSVCICPNGFGGADCSERAPGEGEAPENCGQTVQAEESYKILNGTVDRKSNDSITRVDRSAGCHYHILAPQGKRIEIQFLAISAMCLVDCYYGSLDVKFDDLTKVGIRICCDSHLQEIGTVISSGNLAILSHYSQFAWSHFNYSFSVQYKIFEGPAYSTTVAESSTTVAESSTTSLQITTPQPFYTSISLNCTAKCSICNLHHRRYRNYCWLRREECMRDCEKETTSTFSEPETSTTQILVEPTTNIFSEFRIKLENVKTLFNNIKERYSNIELEYFSSITTSSTPTISSMPFYSSTAASNCATKCSCELNFLRYSKRYRKHCLQNKEKCIEDCEKLTSSTISSVEPTTTKTSVIGTTDIYSEIKIRLENLKNLLSNIKEKYSEN